MKILSVLGWGLLVIILKFLIPKVFTGFENTLLAFFDTAQSILTSSRNAMTAGVVIPTLPL